MTTHDAHDHACVSRVGLVPAARPTTHDHAQHAHPFRGACRAWCVVRGGPEADPKRVERRAP